jgi:hypothetical protein
MKEILTCQIWSGIKIKVVIDRETGEFVLNNTRFRLDIRDDKALLFYYNNKTPLFSGYLQGITWFFEEEECIREDVDPYVAAIQMLYDIVQ